MTVAEIRETLTDMHISLGNIQPNFNKAKYPVEFEKYYKKYEPFFMQLERDYETAEDKEAFLDEVCDAPVMAAKERYASLSRRKREIVMMQEQLALVAFVFPCILYYRSEFSEALTRKICDAWNAEFNMTLKSATYETINSGFARKWCFITTAVCESLQKPDDCRELTMLRTYRDEYLASIENGQELIGKYYDIAPTIVRKIDRRADASAIYSDIYSRYLVPCLESIEEGDNEKCLEQYRDMVESLEKTYMYS